jgi:hypothetical protein
MAVGIFVVDYFSTLGYAVWLAYLLPLWFTPRAAYGHFPIEQGVQSGQLTNKEVSRLEQGQARVDLAESRAGADGHVNAREQTRIQHQENVQSRDNYRDRHKAGHH